MSDHEDFAEISEEQLAAQQEEELERELAALQEESSALDPLLSEAVGGDAGAGPSKSEYDPQAQAESDSRSVYVGNVDYSTTDKELREFFESCGDINRITIPVGPDRSPKGFAYIEFASVEAAGAAMLLTDRDFKGRIIQVTIKRTNTAGVNRGRGRGGQRGGRGGAGFGGFRGPPGFPGYPPMPYGYPPMPYGYAPPPYGGFGGAPRGGRGGARGGARGGQRGGRGGRPQ